ncbi:unnamed protein product [Bursaphelenchus xylophilus]|uniref:(pine wood nematode) hypothetical protein n=1 Tax=Bursaphelenchus xylophilus TaxID=6326 RepID=A0A1I7RV63_BURXY|nr:unnamed protein product [Bursaphelenchus xylophilus]CAG9124650.1 unnamed protein product [Bursaphelenchus xylophilus]
MGLYRYFLVIVTLNDMILTVIIGFLLCPVPGDPFPGTGLKMEGIFSHVGEKGVYIMIILLSVFAGNVVSCQNYGLVYRFVVILPNETFSRVASHPICTVIYIIFCEIIVFGIGFGLSNSLATQEQAKALLIQRGLWANDPITPGSYRILFKSERSEFKSLILGIFAIALFAEFFYLLCVRYILYLIRQQGAIFSKSTYRMHRQLTILLGVQLLVPLICVLFPVCVTFASALIGKPFTSFTAKVGILVIASQSTFSSIMTICFIGPYRRFVLRQLRIRVGAETSTQSNSGFATTTRYRKNSTKRRPSNIMFIKY